MADGVFLLVLVLAVYFIPSFVGKNKKYASGIFLLNLFLGWTFVGWVGAFVWAVSSPLETP